MPSKLQRAIGAVKDQTSISLAKVSSNTYSNIEVAVLKATTHDDDVPIDFKSVNEVLRLISSNKFYAAAAARTIGRRIGRTRSWVVALKSLMLILRIFQDGDPYFPREVLHAMRRGAKILNLSGFRDDSNSSSPWDFTSFVRTFALYLDERLECFLTGKLQRRYTHGPSAVGVRAWQRAGSRSMRPREPIRDMKPAMLLDRILSWQLLLERAIATRPTGPARASRLVHVALYAIVQESFDLYKDVSDGLTLILDSFFHLQFQNCVSAFQACAKAAKQFRELNDFYSLCKSIGVGRTSEYPSVQTISEDLIGALQEFLKDQNSFPPKPSSQFTDPAERSINGLPQKSECTTSLEDLIKASETGTCPAISIDLEAYSSLRQDDGFNISETGSTRSLPVLNSMTDLMSLWDWSEQEDIEQQQIQQEQEQTNQKDLQMISQSSNQYSKYWELVLTEALSSTSDNTTTSRADEAVGNPCSTSGWEVVLFEATPPAQPYTQPPTPPLPTNNHYNPFLQDALEVTNFQPATPAPTFRAIPSYSVQNNQTQMTSNDPFDVTSFNGNHDRQNLLVEQELWLRNQNKIIAKHNS